MKSERDRSWILIVVALSPFALFNSVYVWPKMLAGAFGLVAFSYLLVPRNGALAAQPMDSGDTLRAGACYSALSLMAHGAGAIATGLVVLWRLVDDLRTAVRRNLKVRHWAGAGLLALLILAPWLLWQRLVQPPGNALLKYAFAGTYGFEETGIGALATIRRAYGAIDFHGWLGMRWEAVLRLFGEGDLSRFKTHPAIAAAAALGESLVDRLRVRDFFFLAPAMSVFLLAAIALALMSRSRGTGRENGRLLFSARRMTAVSLLTYALSIFMLWNVHLVIGLGYVAHLLLMLGPLAGLLALGKRTTAMAIAALSVGYSTIVWLADPLVEALRVDGFAVLLFVLCIAYAVVPLFGPSQAAEGAEVG